METSTKIIIGLVIAIMLSAGAIGFSLFRNTPQETSPVSPEKNNEVVGEDSSAEDKYNFGLKEKLTPGLSPRGTIALSLTPADMTEARPSLHLFNLESDTQVSDSDTPREMFNVGTQFAGDGSRSYYAATLSEESLSNRNDHFQVHFVDLAANIAQPIQIGEGENERYLDWNEQRELLVYTRQVLGNQHSYDDMIDYKNAELVILDVKNKTETVVGKGGYGKWSPEGDKLFYAATDGLHLYDLETKQDRLIVNSRQIHNAPLTAITMIDLSPDGNYLVWTSPHLSMLSMFKITSWDPFVIEEIGRMSDAGTEYYWPTFSPDSNYYIVQAKDRTDSNDPTRLEIREVESREVVKSYSLKDFDFNKAFIDDWVE